MAASGKLSC